MPTSINSSGITFPNGTTQTTAATASGTVTSVATGNGLSGGTITTSGTLTIACPTYNTVGSYAWVAGSVSGTTVSAGSNYAAGTNNNQLQSNFVTYANTNDENMDAGGNISGTWKWMSRGFTHTSNGSAVAGGVACRVS